MRTTINERSKIMADIHGVLHPYPSDINWEGGYLKITRHINLTIPVDLSHETLELFKSTWNSFTQSKVKLSIISNPVLGSNSFRLSSTEESRNETSLKSGNQSALSINRDGVCGIGISETYMAYLAV